MDIFGKSSKNSPSKNSEVAPTISKENLPGNVWEILPWMTSEISPRNPPGILPLIRLENSWLPSKGNSKFSPKFSWDHPRS